MSNSSFPWRKTFVLGFGFFGISIVWPLFNSLVPPFLEDLGLTTIAIGFILTWDNIINACLTTDRGETSPRFQVRQRLSTSTP